jgi:hypothetical protein
MSQATICEIHTTLDQGREFDSELTKRRRWGCRSRPVHDVAPKNWAVSSVSRTFYRSRKLGGSAWSVMKPMKFYYAKWPEW